VAHDADAGRVDLGEGGQGVVAVGRDVGQVGQRLELDPALWGVNAAGVEPEDPEIANAPDLHKRLQAAVDRVNADLSVIEKIRRFILADDAFTIENEQLTPSMKIRRHVISKVYGERLDALYKR